MQEFVAVLKDNYRDAFRDKCFVSDSEASNYFSDVDLCLQSEFKPRNEMEGNKFYLQLVTYTFLINPLKKKIFVARRINGDKRLNNLYCIGFGGHVDIYDFKIEDDELPNPILKTAIRELREEVKFHKKELNIKHIGFVRDLFSSTSEHLGSVYYLITGNASILEKHKLADGRWVDYEEFKEKYYHSLESWSKAIFDFIYEDEVYSKLFGLAS